MKRSVFFSLLMLILGATLTSSALAQNSDSSTAQKISARDVALPKILILPWQTPGIDPDSLRITRQARDAVSAKLKETFSPLAESLDKLVGPEKIPASLQDDMQRVFGDPNPVQDSPLAIIPVWTHFHDYELLGLLAVDSNRNSVRYFVHKLIPRDQLIEAYKNQNVERIFGKEFASFASAIKPDNLPKPNEELAVNLREQAASRRMNEIDRTTLNLLIAYQIATKSSQLTFTLINPYARELITSIHRVYGKSQAMRKPNRIIFTKLTYEKNPKAVKLPLSINLGITVTEGVFGRTIPDSWFEPLTIAAKANGDVDLTFSNKLSDLLDSEQKALKRDELPQIIKIRGAWAYVDKGRAWGLQMNDRLVIADGSGTVKGHVVGYYGPEMKLTSQRGYKINEGAIIFIRKGQKSLKEGQILTYDAQKVPSF